MIVTKILYSWFLYCFLEIILFDISFLHVFVIQMLDHFTNFLFLLQVHQFYLLMKRILPTNGKKSVQI